jgi:hypothetical protein
LLWWIANYTPEKYHGEWIEKAAASIRSGRKRGIRVAPPGSGRKKRILP